jgi:DNA-nicking Smr family endonuclease
MAEAARGRRQPTPDEIALWRHVTRDVVPAHSSARDEEAAADPAHSVAAPTPPVEPARPRPVAAAPAARTRLMRASQRLDPGGPVDLDRRTWQRLRRGQYPVDARLDLHGMTQAEAHSALAGFLATAQGRGNRCVLVITGRGLSRGGTLREMTPRWLDEAPNRRRVLAFATAQQRHGGDGALYVLLRRPG